MAGIAWDPSLAGAPPATCTTPPTSRRVSMSPTAGERVRHAAPHDHRAPSTVPGQLSSPAGARVAVKCVDCRAFRSIAELEAVQEEAALLASLVRRRRGAARRVSRLAHSRCCPRPCLAVTAPVPAPNHSTAHPHMDPASAPTTFRPHPQPSQHHRYIVRLLSVHVTPAHMYLALEHAGGGTLAQLLASQVGGAGGALVQRQRKGSWLLLAQAAAAAMDAAACVPPPCTRPAAPCCPALLPCRRAARWARRMRCACLLRSSRRSSTATAASLVGWDDQYRSGRVEGAPSCGWDAWAAAVPGGSAGPLPKPPPPRYPQCTAT